MSSDVVSQLVSLAQQLVGIVCWRVSAGGATGSRFNLDFGVKLEWGTNAKSFCPNSMLKDQCYGEYGLQVGCAAWRLDDQCKPITAWTDVSVPDGPMVTGLNLLQNRIITSSEIIKPGLDLIITFDNAYVLRVFCDQFEEPYDNYTLSFRNTYVSVAARSRIIVSEELKQDRRESDRRGR